MGTNDEPRATSDEPAVKTWQQWNCEILGPAVLEQFDLTDESQRQIAGAIREIAAASFAAGERYGRARAKHPEME